MNDTLPPPVAKGIDEPPCTCWWATKTRPTIFDPLCRDDGVHREAAVTTLGVPEAELV